MKMRFNSLIKKKLDDLLCKDSMTYQECEDLNNILANYEQNPLPHN